jgi:hypothetical protein
MQGDDSMNRDAFTVIGAGLNVISAILTAGGYQTFVVPLIETAPVPSWVITASAFALGFGLSAIVQWMVNRAWTDVGLMPGVLVLTLGLMASTLSFLGGAAGIAYLQTWEAMEAEARTRQGDATAEALEGLSRRLSTEAGTLRALAREASLRAADEEAGRPTCVNDTATGSACGPRCRLRQRQQAALEAQSGGLDATAGRAAALVDALRLAPGTTEQRAVYEEARRLSRAPERRNTAETLRRLAGEFGRPLTDPVSGTPFQCDDPDTATRLTEATMRIEAPAEMPARPPQAVRVSVADAVPCVIARVGGWAGLGAGCASDTVTAQHVGLALALELATVLCLVGGARRLRQWGGDPRALDRRHAALRPPTAEERSTAAWLVAAAAAHLVDLAPEGCFVAVPCDRAAPGRVRALALARMAGAPHSTIHAVDLGTLDGGGSMPAGLHDLHLWSREADRLLERAHLWAPLPEVADGPDGPRLRRVA